MKNIIHGFLAVVIIAGFCKFFMAAGPVQIALANTNIDNRLVEEKFASLSFELEQDLQNRLATYLGHYVPQDSFYITFSIDLAKDRFLSEQGFLADLTDHPAQELPGLARIPSTNVQARQLQSFETRQLWPYIATVSVVMSLKPELSPNVGQRLQAHTRRFFERVSGGQAVVNFSEQPWPISSLSQPTTNMPASDFSEITSAIRNFSDQYASYRAVTNDQRNFLWLLITIGAAMALISVVLWRFGSILKRLPIQLGDSIHQSGSSITDGFSQLLSQASPKLPSTNSASISKQTIEGTMPDGLDSHTYLERIGRALTSDLELAILAGFQLLQSKQFDLALILLGAVQPEVRQKIQGQLDPQLWTEFQEFVRTKGVSTLHDEKLFAAQARNLYQRLWLAMQDRDSIIHTSVEEILVSMQEDSLAQLWESLTDEELSAYLAICGPHKMALSIAKGRFPLDRCRHLTQVKSDAALVSSIFRKATAIAHSDSSEVVEVDPIQQLSDFLPPELEVQMLELAGRDSGVTFLNMAGNHIKDVAEWIKSNLNVPDAAALLALLPTDLVNGVLNELPEITARRIQSLNIKDNERSLELKASLQIYLRTLSPPKIEAGYDHVA